MADTTDSSKKFINATQLERLARALDDRHNDDFNSLLNITENLEKLKANKDNLDKVESMLGGRSLRYLTQEEYDALSDEEKSDKTISYCITDRDISDCITEEDLFKILPCYDTRENEVKEYTYDGIVGEREQVTSLVKISNDIYTLEDIENSYDFVIEISSEDRIIDNLSLPYISMDEQVLFNNNKLLFLEVLLIVFEDCEVEGYSFTKGIWFLSEEDRNAYVSRFKFIMPGEGEFKQLNKKFMTIKPGENVEGQVMRARTDDDEIIEMTAGVGAEIFNITGSTNIAVGQFSHAEGYSTQAIGTIAHSQGFYTTATGNYSHAEGYETAASGESSHAEGEGTRALGNTAHSEGYNTEAKGDYSHAEGYDTSADGEASHAEGHETYAIGEFSHVEGAFNSANGSCSHAEGSNSKADGVASHVEGFSNEAIGNYSHAEGYDTKADGVVSHSEGSGTEARGNYSHAEGFMTIAMCDHQHVQGRLNIADEENKYAHIVGNGQEHTDDNISFTYTYSNAHTLDWDGNAWFQGDITIGADNKKLATEEYVDSKEVNIDAVTSDKLTTQDKTIVGAINELELEMFEAKANVIALDEYKLEQEDLPCYDTRVFERRTYTLTNPSTQVSSDFPYEKVSDDIYTVAEIENAKSFKFVQSGSHEVEVDYLEPNEYLIYTPAETPQIIYLFGEVAAIITEEFNGHQPGFYLANNTTQGYYFSEASFDYAIQGELKVLDDDFLKNTPGKKTAEGGEIFNDYSGNQAGLFSHAEGYTCWATDQMAHAEGYLTEANGFASHSEGYTSIANGNKSHAEGCGCVTNAESAHAEGYHTIASSICQHVEGRGNIEDKDQKYLHIVGNGTANARRNAYTLDWDGNAWFAGKATVSVQPTNNNDLTTKKYVDDIAANKVDVVEGKALINTGEIARLSKVDNYNDAEVRGLIEDLSESKADATSIPTKVSQLTNDSGFLTAVPAMYATQAYVADAINKAQLDGSDSEIDLSPYALTSDLALKADKTELHTHENQTLLNSITAEHLTSMAEISDTLNGPRNYYNAEAITDGVYLNSNGLLYENPIYFTTDYIPIAPGQTLYFYGANGRYNIQSNVRFVGFFDAGRNFIAGSIVSNVNKATNTYENGAYIRITVQHSGWGLGYVENVYPGVDIKYGEHPESKLWEKPQKIDVFLPNDIYCAVGTTIELYNNQVCLQADKLHLNWCCDYGHAMKRKFSFEGTSALAGQIIPVTLEIYNDYNVLKYTKTIKIHVVAATLTNPITCVPIGDSWTNQKPWPGEVINLSGEKISFVGKFNTTVKDANGNWREYNHEGRSGFSAYNYDGAFAYTFGNAGEDTYHAFYNPTTARFDWNNYVNTVLGGTQPGAVILQMGINGIAADNTGMVGHEVNMINLIRQDNADIPIFVTLPAYKGNQDGLGVQESSDGHAYHRGVYDYLEKQKVMNYCSLLYEACKDIVGVYFIPLNICFDSEYNYGAQEVPVNPRATSIIEKIPMEAVHPQDYGYYQMADIVYSVMCGNLS